MRACPVLLVATLAVLSASAATLQVTPPVGGWDQAVAIVAQGLASATYYNVTNTVVLGSKKFHARAMFRTDGIGMLDLTTAQPAPPYSSSWDDFDPMGLFWGMQPVGDAEPSPGATKSTLSTTDTVPSDNSPFKSNNTGLVGSADGLNYTLSVELGGTVVATAFYLRQYVPRPVIWRHVDENGLVGVLVHPADGKRHPAIIRIGGSEGGIPSPSEQAFLAAQGYSVLCLAYFNAGHLPATLTAIPLEYFHNATTWLLRQSEVVPTQRPGVFGTSRGGEGALAFTSHFPDDVGATVVDVGSGVPVAGAWTFRGEAVPGVDIMAFDETCMKEAHAAPPDKGNYPTRLSHSGSAESYCVYGSLGSEGMGKLAFPLAKVTTPVLLRTAGADFVWPSRYLTSFALRELAKGQASVEVHNYDGMGHVATEIYSPAIGLARLCLEHPVLHYLLCFGGRSDREIARGSIEWHHARLAFWRRALPTTQLS